MSDFSKSLASLSGFRGVPASSTYEDVALPPPRRLRRFIKGSDVLYIDPDKSRADNWFQGVGLQLPSDKTNYGSMGNIELKAFLFLSLWKWENLKAN